MGKLFGFLGASVGGWIGWAAGAPVGVFTAFVVSTVASGIGMYAGKRFADHLES